MTPPLIYPPPPLPHTCTLRLPRPSTSHTRTHTPTHTHTRTHTHTPTPLHTHTPLHTQTHPYTHTHTPLHTPTHTELEDNMLNLQTIAGSRFVSAFIDRVRQWERTLNLVSECLEAWFIVQRKWAYLEGIFIGEKNTFFVHFITLIYSRLR